MVAAEQHPSLASTSRYCAGQEFSPSPARDPSAFVQVILEIVSRRNTELLLPVTEIATTQLAEQRHRLPPGCVLPLPATKSLQVANDKRQVLDLAEQLGIPTPRTLILESPEKIAHVALGPFPTVIKPTRSRVQTPSGWLSAAVDYAEDAEGLIEKLQQLPLHFFPVLLQERIVGSGIGVFTCYQHGHLVAMFSHRRLREKPPSGGVSVLCESIALDHEAADYAHRLLTNLGWHGVAMVEFKRSQDDGSLRLMEINGRFWGSLQLAIDAGVDFPGLVARIAAGETIEPVTSYEVGVRSRWFLGDLDSLLAILFRSSKQLQLPDRHPGRMRAIWRVLGPSQRDQLGEVLRQDDMRPGLLELAQWLRRR